MREGLYVRMQREEVCHVTILIEIPSFAESFFRYCATLCMYYNTKNGSLLNFSVLRQGSLRMSTDHPRKPRSRRMVHEKRRSGQIYEQEGISPGISYNISSKIC